MPKLSMNPAEDGHELPAPPLGFLRHRSGSFDASSDGPLIAAVEPAASTSGQAARQASDTSSDHVDSPHLPVMSPQPAEIEEGATEYKLLLAPESAGKNFPGPGAFLRWLHSFNTLQIDFVI